MKKILVFIGILVLIIILMIFGLRMIFGNKSETVEVLPTPSISFPTISDNIIVDLAAKDQNRAVVLKIKGLESDTVSVEYELTYITGNGLPRGVIGKIKLQGEKEIVRDDIVLGTCSSGRCVYDTGVAEVNLSLKFNSTSIPKVFQKKYILSS